LPVPSYFIGGGYKLAHNNTIFAFGHGVAPQNDYEIVGQAGMQPQVKKTAAQTNIDGKKPEFIAGTVQHKKYLHQYQLQN